MYVTGEFDCGITRALLPHGLDITSGLRMISAGDHQPGVWQNVGHSLECIDHEFEALVGSPLAKCEDAVLRISAAGKIRVFRSARQNTMRPNVNIVAAIFLGEDPAVAGHEHRHRI
jgi:hypothetical protein